jgi:hypothetical protein
MRVNLTRIAVAQLGCIFYCMGAAALSGKLSGMSGFAPLPLAAFVRNYGLLLTLVPIVWLIGSLLLRRRTNADDTDLAIPFFSGWGLTLGFFSFALWLTFAPMMYTSKTSPPQRSEQLRGQPMP